MRQFQTILLAEDDIFQQKIIRKLLEKEFGATVLCASNGDEAKALLQLNTVDAIITDLAMPKSDGVLFLYDYFKSSAHKTPIAIVSASANEVMNSVKNMAPKGYQKLVTTIGKPVGAKQIQNLSYFFNNIAAPDSNPVVQQGHKLDDSYESIKNALQSQQIVPFFQGQYSGENGSIISVEALVRWNHPVLGTLAPHRFIDQVYTHGLGTELCRSLLEQVLKTQNEWKHFASDLSISVNMTQQDLCSEKLIRDIEQLLRQYNVGNNQLTIEVTESDSALEQDQFLKAASSLRLLGVNLAIDDFGTGFSSLTNLVDGPYNEIKIDISYVQRMMTCQRCKSAVESIVLLGRNLDMTIVAEGVETMQQAQMLQQLGSHKLQGYYYCKPVSAFDFQALLMNQKA